MPATRKSSRLSGGSTKQSTLSFNHRVTKNVPKSVKESIISSDISGEPPLKAETAAAESQDTLDVAEEPKTSPEPILAAAPEKSPAELKAEKTSIAAVERYWQKVEAERLAKRVHQEGLTTGEKVLRYFDVSSQYGVSRPMHRSPSISHSDKYKQSLASVSPV